ncbi:four-carbon acid sugar kinase family protein [Kribbella sp. GL6]|uniref:four-carbon acid sugar kinase family protein n=1 Tax=Kribbella sp. GL6 TaxID=3419765 RepID=UPI003CFEB4E9
MPELAIVADDLSGAAEAAAAHLLHTSRISVGLSAAAVRGRDGDRVVAIDTDSRRCPPAEAAVRVRAALEQCKGIPVLKKVDSLLRGNLAAEVRALYELSGVPPVVATALPSAGRTVVDGVLRVGGVPLHESGLWHAEGLRVPRNLSEALAPVPTVLVPLATVRDGEALAKALASAAADLRVAVCDAETDADLDLIHHHAAAGERSVLVGSGGLAAAAARALAADDPVVRRHSVVDNVLVVVGTAAPSATTQLEHLESTADVVVRLTPDDLLRATLTPQPAPSHETSPTAVSGSGGGVLDVAARVRGAQCAVVCIDGRGGVRPELAERLAVALAAVVGRAARERDALVLTGGETARGVLDLLGVDRLVPVAERHGAVVSRAGGRVVVTRPGSFGGPMSLADLVTSLSTAPIPEEPTDDH